MAWIQQKKRSDGGTSAVRWRLGGPDPARCRPKPSVRAATTRTSRAPKVSGGWWRQEVTSGPMAGSRAWASSGHETPTRCSRRRRCRRSARSTSARSWTSPWPAEALPLTRCRILASVEVPSTRGAYRPFDQPVTSVHEADVKAWLIDWDRSLKTKANYHGLLYGVFNYALEQGFLTVNPCARTAPKRSRIRQSQADLRFLTEAELATAARVAGADGDLLTVAVGTGLRFGEVTALWVSDVDLVHRTIRINKAWKRDGENDVETPSWLRKVLASQARDARAPPRQQKTPKSRRTVTISSEIAWLLAPGRRQGC